MDSKAFISIMEDKSIRRKRHFQLIAACLDDHTLVEILILKMTQESEYSPYYARVLELVAKQELSTLFRHLDSFTNCLNKLRSDGCCRAAAKICELLLIEFKLKKEQNITQLFTTEHQEKIIEVCFDWKINNRAVAIQAHSMYTLYLLGFNYDWIHQDLVLLIEKNLPEGSTGYKNRGRKIIKAIQTGMLYKL